MFLDLKNREDQSRELHGDQSRGKPGQWDQTFDKWGKAGDRTYHKGGTQYLLMGAKPLFV